VSEATPLSRFLIESAREGLDLNTAEGRAHLSSNAKPLWSVMPEGALKMQLLGEIADLVQLTGRELSELWNPAPPSTKPARDSIWKKGQGSYTKGSFSKGGGFGNAYGNSYGQSRGTSRPGGRSQPASRADHATRILLGQSALWDTLSNEDHGLLCHLAEPHGPLLAWLEGQMHEHGALPWEALRDQLVGHPSEDLVLRLMSGPAIPVQPVEESAPELRDLLNRMLVDDLKAQETEAIDAAKSDPAALQRYKTLRARRVELMAVLEKTQSEGIIQG
jgi:DNA primase